MRQMKALSNIISHRPGLVLRAEPGGYTCTLPAVGIFAKRNEWYLKVHNKQKPKKKVFKLFFTIFFFIDFY